MEEIKEEVVKVIPASESLFSLVSFVILGIIDLVLIGLSLVGIALKWDQFEVGRYMAFAFLVFTLILLIYWKKFMPYTLIKKTRRGKKEIAEDYYKEINYD